MRIPGISNFENGRLSLWDKEDLLDADADADADAESEYDPLLVTHIDICAKCYMAYQVDGIISKIGRYKNVDTLHLSDDFIPDDEMESVKNKITSALNITHFRWSHDLVVNGKHGR